MAKALRQLFIDKNTRVLYLTEVIKLLKIRFRSQFIDVDEGKMKRLIGGVSRILPDWLRIVAMPRGHIVRLEGQAKYQIGTIK